MSTLYVNADHPDRSDSWTHAQAADNASHPFATMQPAAMLLQSGDTLIVEPSTLGHANLAITVNPNIYQGITHQRKNELTDILPSGNNSSGDTINVIGHVVDGQRPKCLQLDFNELRNWRFTDFQRGYDLGTYEAFDTVDLLHMCADLKFERILYTGGGYYAVSGEGLIHWDNCATFSPWTRSGSFLAGSGYHLISVDTSTGIHHKVTFRFTNSHFEDCGGEDAIQASLGPIEIEAKLEVIGCTFANISQINDPQAPHTDSIQMLGGHSVLIERTLFINCDSVFIASDGATGRITIINNMVFGGGNGFHGQGCREWIILHNTVRTSGFSIGIGDRLNQVLPDFEQRVQIANNIIDSIIFAANVVIPDNSVVESNIMISSPGLALPWGTQLTGLPEFGYSDRLEAAGIDQPYELANTPIDSPGIGQGANLDDYDLLDFEIDAIQSDILGRPYAENRDVGAFQSDPGVLVGPVARGPYITALTPTGDGQPAQVNWTARLYPVPGNALDPDTVNTSNAYVTAVNGSVAPAVVTLSEMDEDGFQLITINPSGNLRPLVLYTGHLRNISDDHGSVINPVTWQARGPDAPALIDPDAPAPIRLFALNGAIATIS